VSVDFDPLTIGVVDRVAVSVLSRFHPAILDRHQPLEAYGDGNCCYRSVATALFGAQSYHEYVRLRTALEMIDNRDHYDVNSPTYIGSFREDRIETPSYDELINDVTSIGTPVSLIHLYGISAAFNVNILSYIPPSVSTGCSNSPYQVKIVGRGCRPQSETRLTLMWTPMIVPGPGQPFNPTHIVLLVQTSAPVVQLSDGSDTDDVSHVSETESDEQSTDEASKIRSPTTSVNRDDDLKKYAVAVGGQQLDDINGLSTMKVLSLIQTRGDETVHPHVPRGRKENVYFVVDNRDNVLRQLGGQMSVFEDDCGAWKSVCSSKKHPYLINDGKPTLLKWVASQGKYCREMKSGGKRLYVPYDPQPLSSEIITLHRYYTNLATNKNFKRRVTYMVGASATDAAQTVAVYEYFGRHEGGLPHGNHGEPDGKASYIRTSTAIKSVIREQLKTDRPQDVYHKLITENNIVEAPRDSRVVQNIKAADRRAQKKTNGTTTCNNLADEVQSVLTMSQTDNFIRCIFIKKDRVPSVILYTDRQLNELKSFCFNRAEGSVLGFDATFNIAKLFVTPSVYRNVALNRRRTKECPVFLGPVFIHANQDFDTYADFFGHLSAKLADCNVQQLTFGSDDDAAMRKCFKHFFPSASRVACSLHIKKNVSQKLDDIMGKKSTDRKPLLDALFGPSGLLACDDEASLDAVVDRLRSGLIAAAPPEFIRYFERQLLPLYQENVAVGPGFNKWTNNACESENHVLKQAVKWKPKQLPDLINCIRLLVDGQYADADRAICGLGDFVLQPQNARHRVATNDWLGMSVVQRHKAVKDCFRIQTAGATVLSTDGSITVPSTPRGGKKPGQRKRVRNVRTQSRAKRLRTAVVNKA